jgi:PAB-dependent poly(A)-specific ribonuclease subunit 3
MFLVFIWIHTSSDQNIGHVLNMINSKLPGEIDELHKWVPLPSIVRLLILPSAVDRLEGELMSELENGRLVRLLCKFGFINERPE